MKTIIIALIFFSIAISIYAVPDKRAYVNKVHELCPTADIIEVEAKSDYVEIEYRCNGKLYEIALNQQLEVLYLESETKIDEGTKLKIEKKLEKKYEGWVLDEYSLVEMKDTSFYKVEIWRDGIEENAYFSLDGKHFTLKNLPTNNLWSITNLQQSSSFPNAPYNFLSPNTTYELPEILKEVSGISLLSATKILCIQDELGAALVYNLETEELDGLYRFADIGDFEDIATDGKTAWVLRSDGTIFKFGIENYNGKIEQFVIPMNSMNAEGLFYNPADKHLYLASKDQPLGKQFNLRNIYRIDPEQPSNTQVFLSIDIQSIQKDIKEHHKTIDSDKVSFNPSAVAIHPTTGELYVLSASHNAIAIFNNKQLRKTILLPSEIYYKPEGLSFTPNGNLYLSSEGIKKGYLNGHIFYFEMGKN